MQKSTGDIADDFQWPWKVKTHQTGSGLPWFDLSWSPEVNNVSIHSVRGKMTDSILAVTDKFRQIFIIFGTSHPDNPCEWKIVKCPINTCTIANQSINQSTEFL